MPPQQRARKTDAPEPDPADGAAEPAAENTESPGPEPDTQAVAAPEPTPICGACFPGGWNGLPADATTAGCEHGTYAR